MRTRFKRDIINFLKICENSHHKLYSAPFFAADPDANMRIQKPGRLSTWQYRTSFRIGKRHGCLLKFNRVTKIRRNNITK